MKTEKLIDQFRIAELKGEFSVQRKFEVDIPYFKWYLPFPKYRKETKWCAITVNGYKIDIRNLCYELKPFNTKEEAVSWIEKFIKEPIFHYPPFQ